MISKRAYLAAKVLRSKLPLGRRSSEYRRFLIVCRSRTGSNLLRGLLNSHRQILALGELYRDKGGRIGWDLPLAYQSRSDFRLIHADPVGFLKRRIFKPYPDHLSAIGFKVLYRQLVKPETRPVLDHLRALEELRVIHLKRRDALRTFVSLCRAREHQQWIDTSDARRRQRPVAIDPEEFFADYHQTRRLQAQYEEVFQDHPRLELFYEDLVADLAGEMRRVQDFLGVEQRQVIPLTYQQSYLPLSAAISNYAEIEDRLAPFISTGE